MDFQSTSGLNIKGMNNVWKAVYNLEVLELKLKMRKGMRIESKMK